MADAKVTQQKDGDILRVTVSGYIGENADLFNLSFAGINRVVLDLGGVSYLNSIGVKNWILWSSKFPEKLKVQVVNCSTLIVNQINMVAGFLRGDSTVESFYAPFVCESCSREESVLLTRGVEYQYATTTSGYLFKKPDIKCSKCGQPMELDAIETKFFNFLKSIREPK